MSLALNHQISEKSGDQKNSENCVCTKNICATLRPSNQKEDSRLGAGADVVDASVAVLVDVVEVPSTQRLSPEMQFSHVGSMPGQFLYMRQLERSPM